jgi:hypothetical protein
MPLLGTPRRVAFGFYRYFRVVSPLPVLNNQLFF